MQSAEDFSLIKWYLDCITDEGSVFIGYIALLAWKAFSLHYSSVMLYDRSSGLCSDTSLRATPFPQTDGSTICWVSDPLHVDGKWSALPSPVTREWQRGNSATIIWSCLQPGAQAEAKVGSGRRFAGAGYAERLKLTVPPWQLSLRHLRWGHFFGGGETLVWIEWTDATLHSLLLHNGNEIPPQSITDTEIRGNGEELRLLIGESTPLREGTLLTTALAAVPGISKLVPSGILNSYECKWISRGQLFRHRLPPVHGWAVHEAVRFS